MIGAISSALGGLFSATQSATRAANNIANYTTEGYTDPESGVEVSLSEEAVNLMRAENTYKANIASLKTAQEMEDELLTLFDKRD